MKLLLLRCPNCNAPLTPNQDDMVTMCGDCFTAVSIDQTGLNIKEIIYAASDTEEVPLWLPFWVFNGRVNISQRQTQGSNKGAAKDAQQFWGSHRRLYVPAWQLEMPMARSMGQRLTQEQPHFTAIPRPDEVDLLGTAVTPEDALKLIEFIILSIEAERKDWLKSLQFTIDAEEPELWALPGKRVGNKWQFFTKT